MVCEVECFFSFAVFVLWVELFERKCPLASPPVPPCIISAHCTTPVDDAIERNIPRHWKSGAWLADYMCNLHAFSLPCMRHANNTKDNITIKEREIS